MLEVVLGELHFQEHGAVGARPRPTAVKTNDTAAIVADHLGVDAITLLSVKVAFAVHTRLLGKRDGGAVHEPNTSTEPDARQPS